MTWAGKILWAGVALISALIATIVSHLLGG
jgi:hypothetical protein